MAILPAHSLLWSAYAAWTVSLSVASSTGQPIVVDMIVGWNALEVISESQSTPLDRNHGRHVTSIAVRSTTLDAGRT